MTTERSDGAFLPAAVAALLLLWPAFLNGFPLVFSDTGTYLSQAIEHYLGWDRPVFYSFFLLPLHLTLCLWPPVIVQAGLAAWVLHLLRRSLYPAASPWWLVPLAAVLTAATPLPFLVSQLIPDLFAPLLVIALVLLTVLADRLGQWERRALAAFCVLAIVVHHSHLLLAVVLLAVLIPLRRVLGAPAALGRAGLARLALIPVLAGAAMAGVNLAGRGVLALSPYGQVFLLARLQQDGPAADVLARDCPRADWSLCDYRDALPQNSDIFLWDPAGVLIRAGGAKRVAPEAAAIVAEAIRTEPLAVLRAMAANAAAQLGKFDSRDGLEPWPLTVTRVITGDFPPQTLAAYAAARQTRGETLLPPWLAALHRAAALAGIVAALVCLPLCVTRRQPQAALCAATLAALLANAAITGALSGPHDRYQSRIIWLATLGALLAVPALNPSSGRATAPARISPVSSGSGPPRRPASALPRTP